MEFQQNERFMDRGHMTEAPNSVTYSSVVSRDSICIGFLLASLHGFYITAIDLENAYLNVPCVDKICFVGGDECGKDKGRVLLIVSALYGLKSAGFWWISSLVTALQEIGLKPIMAGSNVWIRAEMSTDGYKYDEMLLDYVDDIMIVSHLGDEASRKIGDFYYIKEGSQGPPNRYLGAETEKIQTKDGSEIRTTSSRA